MEPFSLVLNSPNSYPKDDINNCNIKKIKKISNISLQENPSINHFSFCSFFIYDQFDNIKYFNSLNNKNFIKLNTEETEFLRSIYQKIEIQKKVSKNDSLIHLDVDMYDKIQLYFNIPKKNSELCTFISKKLASEKDRKKISCRKLSNAYFEERGKKVSKSTIHNILRKEMGLHYLKTTFKTNYLLNDFGIVNCLCFIKIFTRCIKMNLCPIFIDESKIELQNNHFKSWRLKDEELYFGNSSKDKRNLLLAVGENKVYSYKITIENTNAKLFIDFLEKVIEKLEKEKSKKFFIILDNLPAHKTAEVLEFLKEKKICTVFNAPYKSNFNAVELSFRAIKKMTYSNLYNSIEEAENDIMTFLENESFNYTLLYNYKETIYQYSLYSEKTRNINLNCFEI